MQHNLTLSAITSAFLAIVLVHNMITPASAARPITLDDFFALARVSEPQISPDGRNVVYVVTTVDRVKNSSSSTLWIAPTDGSAPRRQLTNTTAKDRHPRFSPDGRRVLFESTRSGQQQLWVIDLDGGEARQLTTISTEAGGGVWSPDGKQIAFISAVFPEFSDKPFAESDAANKQKLDDQQKNPVKARVVTRLFYRHWDSWVDGKRQHLFVMPADGGEPRDLTPGDRDATPTSSTFSAGDEMTFSPDGKYLYYTAPPEKDEAWSTNHDIWRVPVAGGAAENLTVANPAADGFPRFSPDGRWLAYRAQRRAGYEADRWELMVAPASGGAAAKSLTANFDRSVEAFVWRPDSQGFVFTAEEDASSPIFTVRLSGEKPQRVVTGGSHSALSVGSDGRLACTRASLTSPPEVFVIDNNGQAKNLSQANTALLAQLDLPKPESVRVPGAGGTPMQMWVLKPPGFDAKQKWPVAYLVHGGPQGAWDDNWSFRWCPQLWAAQGYVVALPNPRGSTGFGQEYVDQISGDWGGRCFEDLMAGVAWLENQPYIDRHRLAAAGASFGGYMMNWFAGHTDKFQTLICHCGVYNFDSMYATTDELWFDEWEHGGPPWGNRESYEKFSPHRFAERFKTPMLIIHNDLDFRVPVDEGWQMFTTLQRLGVPSRLVNFPDEGHWVLKPANSEFWHREVFDWLKKYVPPGGK
ncbi:MAG: S9 family peptidase [Pirellulales bacterium]|nr:S9 family peptidase [Pirellulales bacterium]